MTFRLPKIDQRVTIVGRTGSGKTVFGAWLLSLARFDKMPYIIVDYQGDDLLNSIDRIREIDVGDVPRHAGLYIVRPRIDEAEAMESWLWKVWQKEKTGLYFDEAYMLPNSGYSQKRGALAAIMTQGRSKKIPVISLVQRPSQINLFVFSEADYYTVFHLNRWDDKKTVEKFAEQLSASTISGLQKYHSRWYDVGNDRSFLMQPAPDPDAIADIIDERLRPNRRHF